jgi:protein-S-isoprenylcysteine O-methyltransferase
MCCNREKFITASPSFPCLVEIFHVSEFLLAMIFMRDELGWKSWLFSRGYCLAMTFAVAEYFLELWLIPGLKATWWWEPQGLIALLGLAMVLAGEMVRKTAMVTAGRNFTHLIKQTKRPEHVLVTEGIYA